MSRRAAATTAAVAGAAVIVAAAWWKLLPGPSADPAGPGGVAGRTAAAGVAAALARADAMRAPFRCARWNVDAQAEHAGSIATPTGRRADRRGAVLRVTGGDRTLTLGVVADVRAPTPAALHNLRQIRAEFERARVDAVVSLGGMGTVEEDIARSLAEIVRGAPWITIAMPGATESVPAHRAAVAALARDGAAVVDGSAVRIVEIDGAVVGTLPGVAAAGQLAAGADGCVHTADDIDAFAAAFALRPAPRVLASYAPPRQAGDAASDVALGGVHVGEPEIATATRATRPIAVVHAVVDEAALGARTGSAVVTGPPVIVAAGAADGAPLWLPDDRIAGARALVVTVRDRRVAWRRIVVPAGGDKAAAGGRVPRRRAQPLPGHAH